MGIRSVLLTGALLALLLPAGAAAQDDELRLFVRRNFGYSGGSQIQGSFRMEAEGPADLASVTFKVDDQVVGADSEAPFRVDFDTDDYGLGWHDLTAQGETASGRALVSAARRFEFVSAAAGWETAWRIMAPLLGVLLVVMLLVVGTSLLQLRRGRRHPAPLGARRNYGLFGGTICPKCGRPFALHLWGLNLLVGKLDRCDHCGRWSVVRALPLEQLRAAEAAERRAAQPAGEHPAESAEEQLRRQLDDSRFTDNQ
ncbi:MAG: hypothetical protein IT318_07735 [Anaerolineales bacterium]|nr:hypothetical protein [Anaerolineales bacterium]